MESMDPLVDVVAVEVIGDDRLRVRLEYGTDADAAFNDREWRCRYGKIARDKHDAAREPLRKAAQPSPERAIRRRWVEEDARNPPAAWSNA